MTRIEIRKSSKGVALASLLILTAFGPSALAQQNVQTQGRQRTMQTQRIENPAIAAYQRALQGFLPAEARARLQAIDTSNVERGAYRQIAFIAADRSVRQYAAAALDAAGRPFEAGELRQIPSFTDQAGADRALDKLGTVIQTVRSVQRPDRKLTAAIASLQAARECLNHAKEVSLSTGTEMGTEHQMGASAGVQGQAGRQSVANERQMSNHASRAVRASAKSAQQAVRAGSDVNHVADLVIQSFTDMVTAARNPTSTVGQQPEQRSNLNEPRGMQPPAAGQTQPRSNTQTQQQPQPRTNQPAQPRSSQSTTQPRQGTSGY